MITVVPGIMSPLLFHARAVSYSGEVDGRSSIQGK
jgi:hypothetical protein